MVIFLNQKHSPRKHGGHGEMKKFTRRREEENTNKGFLRAFASPRELFHLSISFVLKNWLVFVHTETLGFGKKDFTRRHGGAEKTFVCVFFSAPSRELFHFSVSSVLPW
jgi:hypothetical protein